MRSTLPGLIYRVCIKFSSDEYKIQKYRVEESSTGPPIGIGQHWLVSPMAEKEGQIVNMYKSHGIYWEVGAGAFCCATQSSHEPT